VRARRRQKYGPKLYGGFIYKQRATGPLFGSCKGTTIYWVFSPFRAKVWLIGGSRRKFLNERKMAGGRKIANVGFGKSADFLSFVLLVI
jgi:hypothetical protein